MGTRDRRADAHYQSGLDLLRSADPGTPEALKRAIGHLESALESYSPETRWPRWSAATLNLAQAYGRYARAEGASRQARRESVRRAIELDQQVADRARRRADAAKQAHAHYQLAQLYASRLDGDPAANLEEAIVHCSQALETWRRQNEPLRWARLQRLWGYLSYCRLAGDPVENAQASIEHLEQSLQVLEGMRDTHARDWAEAQYYLGVSRYRLSQLIDDQQGQLDRAIEHLTAARRAYARSASSVHERAETQHRLAVAYLDLNRGNVRETLAQSVDWLEEAAQAYREPSPRWAKVQIDLGVAYLKSMRGGRSESIEQAIACFERIQHGAASLEPDVRALLLHNLSVAYATRLIEDRTENLRQARVYGEGALKAVDPRDRVLWATIQADLAGILWRLGMLERAGHAEQAASKCFQAGIEHGQAVLRTPGAQRLPYLYAFTCYNLANLYADRRQGRSVDDQKRAASYLRRALDFFGPQNYSQRWANIQSDLGVLYLGRGRGDLAIQHFAQALQVLTPEAHPIQTLRVAGNLGHTCFELGRWREARGAYRKAIRAAELLYRASLLRGSKKVELGQVIELYARAGFSLAKDRERRQEALLTLEQGRARLLSEGLERDRSRLQALERSDPELVQRYVAAMDEYDELLRSEFAQRQDATALLKAQDTQALSRKLEQITREIGQDGQTGMLSTLKPEDLLAAARADTPLVYTAVTSAGTLALIVRPGEIRTVWRPLTARALRERIWGAGETPDAGSYLGAYARWRESPRARAPRERWFDALAQTTRWLWDELGSAVGDELHAVGASRAVLIPQGWLGLLPLHVAWTDGGRPTTSKVCFSYAPNARALVAARAVAARIEPDRLFAVSDPDYSLPYSDSEAAAACCHFDEPGLLGGLAATKQAVVEQLHNYPVLHFSCHGAAHFAQPLEGGLTMAHGERLTLREILGLRLKDARLVILSACETGLPGTQLLDEVISLPTGWIQAGMGGAVGSLWAVNDISTTILMARFYELWKGGRGLQPPDALHQAQTWLRDKTNGQRAEHYKRFLPEFGGQDRGLPLYVADALYKTSAQGQADQNDFAHPFYWAAFTYTGV